MNFRTIEIIICTALLALFIWGAKSALHYAEKAMSFWHFMALCLVGCTLILIAAFSYDWNHQKGIRSAFPGTPRSVLLKALLRGPTYIIDWHYPGLTQELKDAGVDIDGADWSDPKLINTFKTAARISNATPKLLPRPGD